MAIRDIFKYLKYFTTNEKNYRGQPAWGDVTQVNGLLLRILDEIRIEVGKPLLIHAAYETSGHGSASEHGRGDAIDFHIAGVTLWTTYQAMQKVLKRYNLQDRVGIGVYFWWASKGFHLDLRGFGLTWYTTSGSNYIYNKAEAEAKMQNDKTLVR